MQLKAGVRLKSVVCTTEVIVVRVPKEDVDLRCGGQPMVPVGDAASAGAIGGLRLRCCSMMHPNT